MLCRLKSHSRKGAATYVGEYCHPWGELVDGFAGWTNSSQSSNIHVRFIQALTYTLKTKRMPGIPRQMHCVSMLRM